MNAPIKFKWDGESFVPANQHWAHKCDNQFVVGETYDLEEYKLRSFKSHNAYFAQLQTCWQNLGENIAHLYPTPDHLRKWCLIKKGYCTQRDIVCADVEQAARLIAATTELDPYAIASVHGNVVRIFQAKSQKMKAMGKAEFQASKEAVLDLAASLIGSNRQQVAEAARAAA